MSNELEALKEIISILNYYKDKATENYQTIRIFKELPTLVSGIETALKENEYLKTELLGQSQELNLKSKALEIIKSKEMLSVFKDISGKCFIVFNTTAIEIPQEEHEILKEILQ